MMNKKLIEYYSEFCNEDSRFKKSKARQIEFEMTVSVLEKHLQKKSKIIDLGAGTGVYSKFYATKGHTVTAVEIVPKHVDALKAFVEQQTTKNIMVIHGDAKKLHEINDNSYDVVLCLGPFYHLRKKIDRIKCLLECKRIVKKDGIIAIAYINRHCAVATFLHYNMNISKNILKSLGLEDYSIITKTDKFLDISYFSDPESTEKQIKEVGLKITDHIGVDGPYALLEEQIEALTDVQYKVFFDYHKKTCRDKSILGYSRHGLILCKK